MKVQDLFVPLLLLFLWSGVLKYVTWYQNNSWLFQTHIISEMSSASCPLILYSAFQMALIIKLLSFLGEKLVCFLFLFLVLTEPGIQK